MAHTPSALTAERLRSLLSYDPETGIFRWIAGQCCGRVAGTLQKKTGYLTLWVDAKYYGLHRLAWLYMTGRWPVADTDHRNRVRSDNRWANLREATRSQNVANSYGRANVSGVKGVTPSGRRTKPWKATITKDGRCRYIGIFVTKEAAATAYAEAANRLHGEFARAGV